MRVLILEQELVGLSDLGGGFDAQLLGHQRVASHLSLGSLPLALLVDSPDQQPAHQVALEY